MKRLLLFLASTSIFAAPVGNPAAPSIIQNGLFVPDTVWCQPRASFAEDFTFQQRLDCTESPSDVQKTFMEGNAQLGTATWSMYERFDLSMTLGTSSNQFRLFEGAQLVEFQTSGGLVWFGDGKLILIEMKDTSFNLFGQAGGWDWMKGPYSIDAVPSEGNANLSMRFWQAGASFSQRMGYFSPYIGIVVFKSSWTVNADTTYRFIQAHDVGPVLGCTLSSTSILSLNVEWRGWFENACNVSGEIRF